MALVAAYWVVTECEEPYFLLSTAVALLAGDLGVDRGVVRLATWMSLFDAMMGVAVLRPLILRCCNDSAICVL